MKSILCVPTVKCYENEYGVHIRYSMYEQIKPLPLNEEVSKEERKEATGDFVGTITFHIKTNSCSINMKQLNPKYTPNDLAKELVKILKSDASKAMLKRVGCDDYKFKPVWSKQLERHFT